MAEGRSFPAASATSAFHVQAGDPRAFANEGLGDAIAEPLPRAGHQRRLALQSHVSPQLVVGLNPFPLFGDELVVGLARPMSGRPRAYKAPIASNAGRFRSSRTSVRSRHGSDVNIGGGEAVARRYTGALSYLRARPASLRPP